MAKSSPSRRSCTIAALSFTGSRATTLQCATEHQAGHLRRLTMFCLSFLEALFVGTTEFYEVEPNDRPTSCLQAIVSLPRETQLEIARDVLKSPCADIYVDAESFPWSGIGQ
jgi:hypothetical protein